ncbi:mog1 [Symbiodinium sp. KB8]|nr:mog1 [Symbiodinium sp. KB8]
MASAPTEEQPAEVAVEEKQVELFGGAITATLPASFIDISRFRTIPDNQEVLMDDQDRSIIVEIAQYEADRSTSEAGQFYWEDIVEGNKAEGEHETVLTAEPLEDSALPHLPGAPSEGEQEGVASGATPATSVTKWQVVGHQNVPKFQDKVRDKVLVIMTLLRVPSKESDIVVHLNAPFEVDARSRTAAAFPKDATPEELQEAAKAVVKTFLESFDVKNWLLFGA